jgi:type IV pilus assembly protein PilV
MTLSQKQSGVGLIEVLVALIILSISLLSIASLQTRSLQFNQSAYWRSQANVLAADVLDNMRVLRGEFEDYELEFGGEVPAGGGAAGDVASAWLENIETLIPEGEGSISCTGTASSLIILCTVSVRWVETSIFGVVDEADLDGEARTTFSYTTSI